MDRNLRTYTKRNIRKGFLGNFLGNLSVVGWLILINFILFFIFVVALSINSNYLEYIALKPSNILQGKFLWTFLTSMFMHAPGGLIPLLSFHLLINMFVLFNLGSLMERIIGKKRFLVFYLLSGIFAGLVFVFLSGFLGNSPLGASIFGSPEIPAVGASGAIFAIAGLFVLLLPKMRFAIIFFPFFSLPGYIMIPLVLVLTWIASATAGLPIGNSAHFGGFIAGLLYGFYLRQKYPKKVRILSRMFR